MDTFNSPSAPASDVDTTINVTTSGPSFDDFDRVEEKKQELDAKIKKKAPKKEEKEETEEPKYKAPTKEQEQEEKVPAPKDEETEETKSTEETRDENAAPEEEDMVEVKINGKVEKVKLDDLKANYSGKVAYDKKFSELDKERKTFQQERDAAFKPIMEFKKMLQEGKAGDAILHLVDMAGEDSYTFNKKLIDAMTPIIKARLEMTPDQLEVLEARSELDHLKKKEQSQLERSKKEQSATELNQRIASLQETHSISDDDFRTAAIKLKERLEEAGNFKPEEFTPELVANFHLAKIHSTRAYKAIDAVDANMGQDPKIASELIGLIFENPEISDQDLIDIVREYSGVNAKLKVLTEKSQVVRKSQAKTIPVKNNKPEFFSDFDD